MGSNPTPSARISVARFAGFSVPIVRIERFEEIEAWQEARALVLDVYSLTKKPSFYRDRNLSDQLRRAAISIVANIAEGFERGSNRQFAQFLAQARGSAGEVRSLLYVVHDLGYIPDEAFQKALDRAASVARLITGFIRYLNANH